MQRPASLLPFLATLAGVALYSLMDVLMKGSSLALGAYSALLWRSIVAVVVVVPIWRIARLRNGAARWPAPATVRLHITRGVVSAGMALTFFWGLARLPMAEAIGISFLAPLIALYLAAVMLGETISRSAVIASLLGLAGVALIVGARIGSAAPDPAAGAGIVAILISAMLYAWNLILQRRQAQLASPLEVASFMNAMVALVLLPFAPFLAIAPDSGEISLALAGSAILVILAGMLFSWAYARAEAQALVPVEYSAFLWAALFGWLAFGEQLAWPTLAGTVLIVAGCWIAAPRRRPEPTSI